MDTKGATVTNASIAAALSTILWFVPGIGWVAGPVLGGAVGGYLQHEGIPGGTKVGGLKGVLMVIPAIPISIIASALFSQIPVVGSFLSGSLVVIIVLFVVASLILGVIGGAVGGFAELATRSDDSSSESTGNIR